MHLRPAEERDIPAILAIYQQYIDTPITFEEELPSLTAFTDRVHGIQTFYPYLAAEEDGRVIGYAYAHRQAERAAYRWNAELSVYLDRNHTGKGTGTRLYAALMELLRLQGIRTVYALVTAGNPASDGLHRAMGFRTMGIQKNTGYRCGAWRDVIWYEKTVGEYTDAPEPPVPFHSLSRSAVQTVLDKA